MFYSVFVIFVYLGHRKTMTERCLRAVKSQMLDVGVRSLSLIQSACETIEIVII
jgi:hypothetical protein